MISAIFGGGDDTDGKQSVQYITGDVVTGHPNDKVLAKLKDRLDISNGASAEYIGIASGPDRESAMKSRYDDYKKSLGINEMRLLYESTSRKYVEKVETELIDYRAHVTINKNKIKGGGGRKPDESNTHYVYVAYKR